jgi:hypothetical protein
LQGLFSPNVQTGMAYYEGRYALNGLLAMHRATGDDAYLSEALDQVEEMVSPTWFKNAGNTAHGQLKAWAFWRGDAVNHVPGGIPQDEWVAFTARAITEGGNVRYQLEVAGHLLQEVTVGTVPNAQGKVALLSSWSRTSFKDLVVAGPGGGVLYSLPLSAATFDQDWERVRNVNAALAEDTGRCELVMETPAGSSDIPEPVITCDGLTDGALPPPEENPDNHGAPATALAHGRYTALVLSRAGLEDLQDVVVTGSIRGGPRVWSGAESGVALRWAAPERAGDALGSRVGAALPDHLPLDHEESNRNLHFQDLARHMDFMFFNQGVRLLTHGWFFGAPNWIAGGGYDQLQDNAKEFQFVMYDGGALHGLLETVHAAYDRGDADLALRADAVLAVVQNHVLARWYLAEQDHAGAVGGGRTNHDWSGFRHLTATSADWFRAAAMFVGMARLLEHHHARWLSVTQATAESWLPPAAQLEDWYRGSLQDGLDTWLAGTWSYPGESALQWWGGQGFWSIASTCGGDTMHNAMAAYLVSNALDLGLVGEDKVVQLTATFTDLMWNGQTTLDAVDYGMDIHGHGSARFSLHNTNSNADQFLLLARFDFRVWEILDAFLEQAWPTMDAYGPSHRYASIHPALLVEMVKYGIPRRPRASCSPRLEGGIQLQWDHPSDWPGGTRLAWYNVYRSSDVGGAGPVRVGTVASAQTAFLDDPGPGGFHYTVRAQDRSDTLRNESLPSVEVSVGSGTDVDCY